MSEQWYSIVEYARTFDVSDMTIRRRIKNGKLKAVLKEGKYYIPVDNKKSEKSAAGALVKNRPDTNQHTYQSSHLGSDEMVVVKAAQSDRQIKSEIPQIMTLPSTREPSSSLGLETKSDEIVNVNSKELLAFCQNFIRRMQISEKNLVEKYENKIESLQKEIELRNTQILNLNQQIEDLQVLIKIVEKK